MITKITMLRNSLIMINTRTLQEKKDYFTESIILHFPDHLYTCMTPSGLFYHVYCSLGERCGQGHLVLNVQLT